MTDTREVLTNLLPCPFCGCTMVAQGATGKQTISVWCMDCGTRGPDVPFPDHCMPKDQIARCHALWNTRIPAPSPEMNRAQFSECLDHEGVPSASNCRDAAMRAFDRLARSTPATNSAPPFLKPAPSGRVEPPVTPLGGGAETSALTAVKGREAFEAWADSAHGMMNDLSRDRSGNGYIRQNVDIAWRAWQFAAALAGNAQGAEPDVRRTS